METPDFVHCPFTDVDYPVLGHYSNYYRYQIDLGKHKLNILIPFDYEEWKKNSFFRENKTCLTGLLLNGQLGIMFDDGPAYLKFEDIESHFKEGRYPDTPQEKYDNLFYKLYSQQKFEGQIIRSLDFSNIRNDLFYRKLFFKTVDELVFYAQSLEQNKLIEAKFIATVHDTFLFTYYRITYQGLAHFLKLETDGIHSKNCFIAMSFGDKMGEVRTAIKEACRATGYSPILVDEIHHDSDTTINDAIIANLKKSRFCIADFTEQKKGVYFESGFALGQGKQVIYSCRNDSFTESHFDTNHFPHLLYDTPDELRERLITKIEAWIR